MDHTGPPEPCRCSSKSSLGCPLDGTSESPRQSHQRSEVRGPPSLESQSSVCFNLAFESNVQPLLAYYCIFPLPEIETLFQEQSSVKWLLDEAADYPFSLSSFSCATTLFLDDHEFLPEYVVHGCLRYPLLRVCLLESSRHTLQFLSKLVALVCPVVSGVGEIPCSLLLQTRSLNCLAYDDGDHCLEALITLGYYFQDGVGIFSKLGWCSGLYPGLAPHASHQGEFPEHCVISTARTQIHLDLMDFQATWIFAHFCTKALCTQKHLHYCVLCPLVSLSGILILTHSLGGSLQLYLHKFPVACENGIFLSEDASQAVNHPYPIAISLGFLISLMLPPL